MSEPNSIQNVQGESPPEPTDDVERIDELTAAWETSPLTDPIESQDPAAGPLARHGDSDPSEESAGHRPDF